MPKKDKTIIKKLGGVTLEILHQYSFKRTVLILYMEVPSNYVVQFIEKKTNYVKNKKQKDATDLLSKEVKKLRQEGASESEIEQYTDKFKDKFEKDNPGPDPKLHSNFEFRIYEKKKSEMRVQDFKFLLPGAEHNIKIEILKCTNILPTALLEKDMLSALLQKFEENQ